MLETLRECAAERLKKQTTDAGAPTTSSLTAGSPRIARSAPPQERRELAALSTAGVVTAHDRGLLTSA